MFELEIGDIIQDLLDTKPFRPFAVQYSGSGETQIDRVENARLSGARNVLLVFYDGKPSEYINLIHIKRVYLLAEPETPVRAIRGRM